MNSFKDPILRWIKLFLPYRWLLGCILLPKFYAQWVRFKLAGGNDSKFVDLYPCLTDSVSVTPFDPHYFFQGAWLARMLALAMPKDHVDIGSDVRMVGVLSGFVPITFIDFRPLEVRLSGFSSRRGNLVELNERDNSVGSLSCLHVIEHIGLGRYGDPLDSLGADRAIRELIRILAPGGVLYISVPVGRERTCFNAHRVFDPVRFVDKFTGLLLESFSFVDDVGGYHESVSPWAAVGSEYACGMYKLAKPQ